MAPSPETVVVITDPAVQRRLLLSLGYTIFFSVLNGTMFNVSLPDIARQFSLLPSEASWVVSGYIILFAVASATYGRLADSYPVRDLIATDILLFSAGSVLGLAARWYPLLVMGRMVQAAGSGAIPALAMLVTLRSLPPDIRGHSLGIIASVVAVAGAVAADLLKPIHPRLWFDEGTRGMLERVQAVLCWFDLLYLDEKFVRWVVYFLGLVEPLEPEDLKEMMGRFKASPRLAAAMVEGKAAADAALVKLFRLGEEPGRSQVYQLLSPISTEFLLYMMAKSRLEASKRAISLYFTHLKHLKPEIRGRDLLALGFQPGPLIKEILIALHQARLNEVVQSKREELDLVRKVFGSPEQART